VRRGRKEENHPDPPHLCLSLCLIPARLNVHDRTTVHRRARQQVSKATASGVGRRTPSGPPHWPPPRPATSAYKRHPELAMELTPPTETPQTSPSALARSRSSSPAPSPLQITARASARSRRSRPPLELLLVLGGGGGAPPSFMLHRVELLLPLRRSPSPPSSLPAAVSSVSRRRMAPCVPFQLDWPDGWAPFVRPVCVFFFS
jgi:hypothetical protein